MEYSSIVIKDEIKLVLGKLSRHYKEFSSYFLL